MSAGENMIPVFTVVNLAELPVAKSVLESAGIPFFVENEHASSVYRGALGIRIFVPRSRAEEAVALLDDIPRA